jgi:hypothetical protein
MLSKWRDEPGAGTRWGAPGKPEGRPPLEVNTDAVDLSWGFTDRLNVDVVGATNSFDRGCHAIIVMLVVVVVIVVVVLLYAWIGGRVRVIRRGE